MPELIGAELDYAVAVATGEEHPQIYDGKVYVNGPKRNALAMEYSPSTNWAQGGPLLDQYGIELERTNYPKKVWTAVIDVFDSDQSTIEQSAPTPLIAICRAVVAHKSEGTNV